MLSLLNTVKSISFRMSMSCVFTDASRTCLVTIGSAPVLVQTGTFRVKIRNGAIRNPEFYALKLNGLRGDRIPAQSVNGEIVFEVNTAKLPVAGPTPFFEIVPGADAR